MAFYQRRPERHGSVAVERPEPWERDPEHGRELHLHPRHGARSHVFRRGQLRVCPQGTGIVGPYCVATAKVVIKALPPLQPPSASDSVTTMPIDRDRLSVGAPGVLESWDDQSGAGLLSTVPSDAPVDGGSVTVNPDGSYVFVPSRISGNRPDGLPDSGFEYVACRNLTTSVPSDCTRGYQYVRVPEVLVANPDTYTTPADTTLSVTDPALGVVGNDVSDIGGPFVTGPGSWFTQAQVPGYGRPGHGTLRMQQDGTFSYTPDGGFSGTDSFLYEAVASDGFISDGHVTITVAPPPDTTAPTVTLSTPTNPTGGTPDAPVFTAADLGVNGTLLVTATAADNAGGVGLSGGSVTMKGRRSASCSSAGGCRYGLGDQDASIVCTSTMNSNSQTAIATYRVQTHAPTLTFSSSPTAGGGTAADPWINASDLGGVFVYPDGPYVSVTVNAASTIGVASIHCTDAEGTAYSTTASSLPLPHVGEGDEWYDCTATDTFGNTSAPVELDVPVDSYAPTQSISTLFSPTGGTPTEPWFDAADLGGAGKTLPVTVSACDGCTPIAGGGGLYLVRRNSDLSSQRCSVDGGTPITASSSPLRIQLADGVHQLSCTATDLAGNTGGLLVSHVYRIDTKRPTATVIDPKHTGDALVVRFSEPVKAASVASFRVTAGDGTALAVVPSCASAPDSHGLCSRWKLSHSEPLVPGQSYTVDLGTGAPIADLAGNPMRPVARQISAPTILAVSDPALSEKWATVNDAGAFGGSYMRDDGIVLPGAAYSFTFTGTSLTWYTLTGPDQGEAQVTITNPGGKTVRRRIDNYSAAPKEQVARAFSGLTQRTHTITITILYPNPASSDGYVAVDAFAVGGSPPIDTPSGTPEWATGAGGPTGEFAYCAQPGASFSTTFRGTSVSALLRSGPFGGIAVAYVDGAKVGTFDLYAPDFAWPASPTTLASGLTDAVHTLRVVVSSASNPASADHDVEVAQVNVG